MGSKACKILANNCSGLASKKAALKAATSSLIILILFSSFIRFLESLSSVFQFGF